MSQGDQKGEKGITRKTGGVFKEEKRCGINSCVVEKRLGKKKLTKHGKLRGQYTYTQNTPKVAV